MKSHFVLIVRILILILGFTACSKPYIDNLGEQAKILDTVALDGRLYPVGDKFPLGLYAFSTDWATIGQYGWNLGHDYYPPPTRVSFVESCFDAGMFTMARLSQITVDGQDFPASEAQIEDDIDTLSATGNIAWWDLPEEQRYWVASEMEIVRNYTTWTREYDPDQLPNYMYIPGHYTASAVGKYVQYLDIIPASCYSNYAGQPASYLRWSIERTFQAIIDSSYTVGKDYLNNEKTVMAILELYTGGSATMSPEQSYHDFWLALACDVRGVLVYSHAYRNSNATLQDCWASLCDATTKFTGTEQLNRVMIEGTNNGDIDFEIITGPQRTIQFSAPGNELVDYPSLKVLAKEWNGNLYIIAVNSNTEPVTAKIQGLDVSGTVADVLFESRSISISSNEVSDTFSGYGVHIYKVAL